MKEFTVSEKDFISIVKQLGRRPNGFFRVKTYAPDGQVQTLETYPLINGRPHPSIYWLVCARLKKQIDRLEASGLIKEWESEILASEAYQKKICNNHTDYQKIRVQLLAPEDKKNLPENFFKTFETTGIGGIADFTRIRCFHMHFAHYLATGGTDGGQNIIGQRLEDEFSLLANAYGINIKK